MPVDLLKELNLPMLNVDNLKKVVSQNTVRLIDLIKEHNYFIEKNHINLPECKEVFAPVFHVGESSQPSENSPTHRKTVNGTFSSDNSQADCDDILDIGPLNGLNEEKTEISFVPLENFQELSNCDLAPQDSEILPVQCSSEARENSSNCKDGEENVSTPESPFCVISDVVGNADGAFFEESSTRQGNLPETDDSAVITPQKTKDITKIKGWRRKQFLVEKPTTVEFYSYTGKSAANRIEIKVSPERDEEPGNVENAFVCDTLDEFLDRDSDLKINYEIPHLYAELGIKLTSEDIVSRPNLKEEDFKEVETKYCVSIPTPENNDWDIQSTKRGLKRQFKEEKEEEDEDSKPPKVTRLYANPLAWGHSDNPMLELSEEFLKLKSEPKTYQQENAKKDLNKMNLSSKLIGLVVYPGSDKPLHPIVQKHLAKIRSYRTTIDKNWANFAASAALGKREFYSRRILPVYICGSTSESPGQTAPELENSVHDTREWIPRNSVPLSKKAGPESKKNNKNRKEIPKKYSRVIIRKVQDPKKSGEMVKKDDVNLKECRVVIDKAVSVEKWALWCMEHNCYDCSVCGLDKLKGRKPVPRPLGEVRRIGTTETTLPRPSFDKEISALLAKTLRIKKKANNGEISTSIDSLKILTPKTVELVKLNFVKRSFLTGYINIWYLRAGPRSVRSRAFLNFLNFPPVPNAINLKSCEYPPESLPKVITEIISADNTFNSNEYAIMHCNGKVWEIHGCLNLAVGNNENAWGKSEKEVEQIFTSSPLPELRFLEGLSWDILKTKSSKWWVLDLIQKFREIEIKSGTLTAVVSRKKFLAFIKIGLFGFISIKKEAGGRVLGAYIFQKLLPFVLIGPYHLSESNGLTVKVNSSTVPFMYNGNNKTNQSYPLKFFINSVITEFEENDKKIEGLWLYNKMSLDNTCYLEVTTTSADGLFSRKQYSIEVEHSYGLNNVPPLESTSNVAISAKNGKKFKKKLIVYLYFEIFELGYVQGELLSDCSVVIGHPLDPKTRMKSYKIGDLFIGIIKRRIRFIPNDLKLSWFITKHKDDLRGRQPFNKFYLGGAHILCKGGLFFMLQLTESKIEELGLDKNEVLAAISESRVISEVMELKNLANILAENTNETDNFSMEEVLVKAIHEVEKQKKLDKSLSEEKRALEVKRCHLDSLYVSLLNKYEIRDENHVKLIGKCAKEIKDLTVEFKKNFKAYPFSRKFIKFLGGDVNSCGGTESSDAALKEEDSEELSPKPLDPVFEKLERKLTNIQNLLEGNTDSLKREELIYKLNYIFEQLNSIIKIFDETPRGALFKKKIRKNQNFIKLNDCVKSIRLLPKNFRVGPLKISRPTPKGTTATDKEPQDETKAAAPDASLEVPEKKNEKLPIGDEPSGIKTTNGSTEKCGEAKPRTARRKIVKRLNHDGSGTAQ